MKRDIQSRLDIDDLMIRFYERATNDGLIGYIFTDVARLNIKHHLPIIGDFWETMIFGTGAYQKHGHNPMRIHAGLNLKTPLRPEHFRRWLEIFRETVDESFNGEKAVIIMIRAEAIADRMLNFVTGVSITQIPQQNNFSVV